MRTYVQTDGPGGIRFVKEATTDLERARLGDEARALSVIGHPNVVEAIDVSGGRLSMAFAGRTTLADAPPRSWRELDEVAQALATIVGELHRSGWVHGGLRPDHVIRGAGGRLVLCSFGRANRVANPDTTATSEDRRQVAAMIRGWAASLPQPRGRADRQRAGSVRKAEPAQRNAAGPPARAARQQSRRQRRQVQAAIGRAGVFAVVAGVSWLAGSPITGGSSVGPILAGLWWVLRIGSLYGLAVTTVWLAASVSRRNDMAAVAHRLTPRVLSRVLVGAALAATAARAVVPTPTAEPGDRTPSTVAPNTVPAPRRPTEPAPPVPDLPALAPPSPTPTPPPEWVVEQGDHFWRIAAMTLTAAWSREPTDREIDRYWRSLVTANRDRLADPANPDLVFPGQRFRLPPAPDA